MTEIIKTVMSAKSENILASGLDAMAKACEAITQQNETLRLDVKRLKSKLREAESKLLVNQEERE